MARKPATRKPHPLLDRALPALAAAGEALVKRGAKLEQVKSAKGFDLCGGRDPDGNRFQICSRE